MKLRPALLVIALLVVVLAATVAVRTVQFTSRQLPPLPTPSIPISDSAVAAHLAGALTYRTISYTDSAPARDAFLGLHAYLARTFPQTHAALAHETVADYALLYTWRGTDTTLAPVVLMAHQDVVPIEPGTENRWKVPPFAGQIVDGTIWGRGALDDKAGVLATLEAVEYCLTHGIRPHRTVYLAFDYNEEIGGSGAAATAALLRSRGVTPEVVLDEGGLVTTGVVGGVAAPVALVGVAEKGYISLALTADDAGGHSSTPPRQTTVGILSAAVARLEANPFPAHVTEPLADFFAFLGPQMTLSRRIAFANLWLFGPLVTTEMSASRTSSAIVRTTTAPTMFDGSVKDNVLPAHARAVVNFRILPGQAIADVTAYVRQIVDDPRVHIEEYGPTRSEPSPVASVTSGPFLTLERTIRETLPDALIAPFLITGATDGRQYRRQSPNVYGFLPVEVTADELSGFHGSNERVRVASYANAVRFMIRLIPQITQ
jgi:carboxypeptidase PM20D1